MQTKWFIVIGIVAAIGLAVGVASMGGPEEEPIVPIEPPTGAYLDVPVGEDFEVSPGVAMEKAAAPACFEFGSVIPGALIDTWTRNGEVLMDPEHIGYVKGAPLWILLYNGRTTSVTFELKCINAPLEVNHSDITGKDYSKAPGSFLEGVSLPTVVTVGPQSCKKVPLSITLPKGLEYPKQWEFRISVNDLQVPGSVTTEIKVRFFFTMR